MGGKLLDRLFSSIEYHIPYVGDVYRRSMIAVGRSGVALPVPKKSAKLLRQCATSLRPKT